LGFFAGFKVFTFFLVSGGGVVFGFFFSSSSLWRLMFPFIYVSQSLGLLFRRCSYSSYLKFYRLLSLIFDCVFIAGQAPFKNGAERIQLTLSAGIASTGEHGTTTSQLVHAADKALYLAKGKGRNRVEG